MASDIEESNRQGGAQALRKSARDLSQSDKPFAILRYAKLKTTGAIRGSSAHMRRTIRTPNADPSRTNGNLVLVGSTDPAADAMSILPETGDRGDDGQLLRRSNSVLAVEVLMTTSPEWFRDRSQPEVDEWIARSREWLEAEWGADNVAHLEVHFDETTPHITGLIIPRDPDTGRLNARRWIGGKASKNDPGSSLLSGHQTRYAEAVEDLGLRRGRVGSTAKHETVASYYRRAAAALEEAPPAPDLGKPPLIGRKAWQRRAEAAVGEAMALQAAGATEARRERRAAATANAERDRSQGALEVARAERRALADAMRELPIHQVLEDLGAEWDASDRRWKIGPAGARDHRIEIEGQNLDGTGTGRKWRCAVMQSGGGGAIDLVQRVMSTDFNGALSWLASRYGADAAASDLTGRTHARAAERVEKARAERPPFTPPAPDQGAWPAVRRYLVEERCLLPQLVDEAHALGNVYAQSRPGPHGGTMVNAVFLSRDEDGQPTGAELKGIQARRDGSRYAAVAPGSDKHRGAFRAGVQRMVDAARVIVVESAIDALSALGWARGRGYNGPLAVVSSAGDGIPEPVIGAIRDTSQRFAGQDNNRAGNRQARRLGEGWTRLTPPDGHEDWNAWAQASARRSDSGEKEDYRRDMSHGPDGPSGPGY